MKLSEAIRLGAMIRPQGKALFMKGASCAMGAALEAYGFKYSKRPTKAMMQKICEIEMALGSAHSCPACGRLKSAVTAIEHLNDFHDWTRERIADWVATIEPQEVANEVLDLPAHQSVYR